MPSTSASAVLEALEGNVPWDVHDAAQFIVCGDADRHYETGVVEPLLPSRRALVTIAALFDRVTMEEVDKTYRGSGTAYATVTALDQAYAELGTAIDEWKRSLVFARDLRDPKARG
jgi:hypothetical protein